MNYIKEDPDEIKCDKYSSPSSKRKRTHDDIERLPTNFQTPKSASHGRVQREIRLLNESLLKFPEAQAVSLIGSFKELLNNSSNDMESIGYDTEMNTEQDGNEEEKYEKQCALACGHHGIQLYRILAKVPENVSAKSVMKKLKSANTETNADGTIESAKKSLFKKI